jgi:hypothetical protein
MLRHLPQGSTNTVSALLASLQDGAVDTVFASKHYGSSHCNTCDDHAKNLEDSQSNGDTVSAPVFLTRLEGICLYCTFSRVVHTLLGGSVLVVTTFSPWSKNPGTRIVGIAPSAWANAL